MAFNFKDTPVAKMADEIRDENQHANIAPATAAPAEPVKEAAPVPVTAPTTAPIAQAPASAPDAAPATVKAKKTTNGIVIDVPMPEYIKLTMMKVQTGRTLKDLALQAIREFVERNDGIGQ